MRRVELARDCAGHYTATNARGGTLPIGSGGDADFTPVELLLAAVAGCSAIDVDLLTSRRAEPEAFAVSAAAEKLRDAHGNHLGPVEVVFTVRFGEGADGDRAREVLPTAVRQSRDRLCTVSRTVQLPTPVDMRAE